jgi:acetyl-CoA synthetase
MAALKHNNNNGDAPLDTSDWQATAMDIHNAYSHIKDEDKAGSSKIASRVLCRLDQGSNLRLARDLETYKKLHKRSLEDPQGFWREQAGKYIDWFRPFDQVMSGDFAHGDITWFTGGKLNVCYNCVDRHAATKGDKTAIIFEGDKPGTGYSVTYKQLLREVCQLANLLRSLGVRKGDRVAIYMPMVPHAAYAMLACARIGAVHSVVFAGFSAEALRDRCINAACKVVITGDEATRGGRNIAIKKTVDEAVAQCPLVTTVLVYKHTGNSVPFNSGRDIWLQEAMAKQRPYCPPEVQDSEDELFLLYTSGSTGQPKGLLHTTAGYLLYTGFTFRQVFDYQDGDVYACVADIGWITGHSYIVYGPLLNGATTLMFESHPLYPDAGRYWDLIQRHKINIFYTAPTAIRSLMAAGDAPVKKYDLSSLRVLGSVGEPINPEAWHWYSGVVGDGQCAVVDTYWQTETGGIICSPLAACTPTKAGSATLPMYGIDLVVVDPQTGAPLEGGNVSGVLCVRGAWPGMARTIFGDHERYLKTYTTYYKDLYFTGDGCLRDQDGYYWITGRVDDVINRAGHRIGTAEVESALVGHGGCAEAACIGVDDDVKGQALWAYVTVRATCPFEDDEDAINCLKAEVKKRIGSIAVPDFIVLTPSLPKTRSGKIMRRVLRKIAQGEHKSLGDLSTLADPDVIPDLVTRVATAIKLQTHPQPPAKKR